MIQILSGYVLATSQRGPRIIWLFMGDVKIFIENMKLFPNRVRNKIMGNRFVCGWEIYNLHAALSSVQNVEEQTLFQTYEWWKFLECYSIFTVLSVHLLLFIVSLNLL